jgi:hypothetical protein
VIEPTLYNVCEYWFIKDHNRIRDLRIDTLSQMLHLSDVQPGRRYLAVDDVSGLLVAAILDRLNGMQKMPDFGHVLISDGRGWTFANHRRYKWDTSIPGLSADEHPTRPNEHRSCFVELGNG